MGLYLICGVVAYVLGSIPFGLVMTKIFGKEDPRNHGSRNIGFTNVLRVSGKKIGFLTLLGDFGKGLLISILAALLAFPWPGILLLGIVVVLGHVFSVFLGFKGGKGVATAFGSITGLHPLIGLILIMIWLGTVAIFRYSSGGALAAFGSFPILAYFMTHNIPFCIYALCLLVIIYGSHQENILRLLRGTENKMRPYSS